MQHDVRQTARFNHSVLMVADALQLMPLKQCSALEPPTRFNHYTNSIGCHPIPLEFTLCVVTHRKAPQNRGENSKRTSPCREPAQSEAKEAKRKETSGSGGKNLAGNAQQQTGSI